MMTNVLSDVVVHDAVIELFDLSNYALTLSSVAKNRYISKLNDVVCDCPYSIEDRFWTSGEEISKIIPEVHYGDIWNYLVYQKSHYTQDEMKNFKSCSSWKIIACDGMFFDMKSIKLRNCNIILKARVHHSMAFSLPPLRPWVAFNSSGCVITAHCDCVAGLSECCSHVGAVLFAALQVVDQRRKKTCTEKPCQWLQKSKRPAMIETVSQIKNTQKAARNERQVIKHHTEISEKEFDTVMKQFLDNNIPCGLLTVLPQYSYNFIPQQIRIPLPKPMSSLYKENLRGTSLNVLLVEAEQMFCAFQVSEEQSDSIELLTRKQSKSDLWFEYRVGRITASIAFAVTRTELLTPAKSVVLKCCYPFSCKIDTPATRWGIANEKKAIKKWKKLMEERHWHNGFKISPSGLRIRKEYPFLAATPDAFFNCPCHGVAVVEVKCPYKHKNVTVRTAAAQDKEFCLVVNNLGRISLRRNHPYYYQIQLQMLVCQLQWCYFLVYTEIDLVTLRIPFDEDFANTSLLPKCKLFALNVLLPELMGKYFTETRYKDTTTVTPTINRDDETIATEQLPSVNSFQFSRSSQTDVVSDTVTSVIHSSEYNSSMEPLRTQMYGPCFCNVTKPTEEMIHCANQSCRVRSFHRSCLQDLGKKRFYKNWICDSCRKKVTGARKALKEVNR